MLRLLAITSLLLLGCSSSETASEPTHTDSKAEPSPATPADASPPLAAPVPPPVTGRHLDGSGSSGYRPRDYQRTTAQGKSIELVLRSTPPGAQASIDGKLVGTTPAYWAGVADGRSHEFTFVKGGHSMARYRFVSTQSGVVHASLIPLVSGAPVFDAGIQE